MYSGSTMTPFSGRILGAHQKIDRLARRNLDQIKVHPAFPSSRSIAHFEGNNGPDAIKRKSPAKDEPWHYFQPFDDDDLQLIELIEDHYLKLVDALKSKDKVRSAFEAAWLSHAIVDGLTPAHHYPYEEKLVELSEGQEISKRTSIGKKLFIPGDNLSKKVKNNWKMYGPKGLMSTHASFELGVAFIIAPSRVMNSVITQDKINNFQSQPLGSWFRQNAQDVARLEIYDDYYKTGWTVPLSRRVRNQLIPIIVQTVTLAWYGASLEANKKAKK